MIKKGIGLLSFALLFMAICLPAQAQQALTETIINGCVKDSVTGEGLAMVTVFMTGANEGVLTADDGAFSIATTKNFKCLTVSAVGYKPKQVYVTKGASNHINILMQPTTVMLNELVVTKKQKYTKKGNPAVAFVEKIMAHKHDFDPKGHDYYSYGKYEKMSLGFNDFSQVANKNLILRKFKFLSDYMDTSEITGKKILPLSIKEKVSTEYFRKSPSTHKEYVTGIKNAGLDESFDQESVKRFLDDVFREIDIFGNDVTFMQNRFVSPLSNIGTNFYKYYLNDTIDIDGEKCVELSFVPFTPQAFGFLGRIYVPLGDSTYFIKKVKLNVPRHINLNYVEHVFIEQDYIKGSDGSRLKTKDDMTVEFKVLPNTQGMYARRETAYKNFSFDTPEDLTVFGKSGEQIISDDANYLPDQFWADNRPAVSKSDEGTIKKMLQRLRQSKLFYWSEKVIVTLVSGYIRINGNDSKFDFGPMNTTISGNSLEGLRLRVGGMTTANLNNHLFAKGYAAYGFKDKKWKYQAQVEYSFNEKKYHTNEFPINSIRIKHQYDVDQLGQHYMYTNADNVFLALKRQTDDKINYLRTSEIEYKLETKRGFSFSVGIQHNIHEASQFLPFENGYGDVFKRYTEAGFNMTLRYAPGEKFYQTRNYRIPINLDAPIITLSQTYVPKGFLGSDYEINKTELGIQKRFWFSAFGYTDIILKAGKIWSKVSYPDLLLPNANLSYTIQPESYTLLNAMEFANDQYLSWDFTYWANGAILNRIPLVKYLKLREVFSFRGLYGKLSDKNNPEKNNDLYRFPIDTHCRTMDKTPYMEIGVGLDNIFTFLRLDYVWRLTYRHNPGVDRSGIRVQLHFTF